MAKSHETTEYIPDNDPSIAGMIVRGVWEVPETLPVLAHYGIPKFDLSPRLTQDEIDIADNLVCENPESFPGLHIIFAEGFMDYFGAGELADHEEMTNVYVVYDGRTSAMNPRLMKHDRRLDELVVE